jgi:predicted acetyltransferase
MDKNLTYRLPTLEDRDALTAYVEEHHRSGENSISAGMRLTSMRFEDWVAEINRNVEIPNGDWGRSYTLLCFDEEKLVGLLSVRCELSEELSEKYGHIGYGVRPTERRKGYATGILRHALDLCREKGLEQVILGCYRENIGSIKTILKNNGRWVRECEGYTEGKISRYYVINL